MEFANKEYFLLLLLLIPYIAWYIFNGSRREPTMKMSDTRAFEYGVQSWRTRLIHLPALLRCLIFALIIIVLARPQTHNAWGKKSVEGIDIMMAMDISTSMLAEDLRPNRMEAAKNVAAEFIAGRPNDNIGLTIFAGEAFTQCPMTTDHASLMSMLGGVTTDVIARGLIPNGTAIGMGLANAVSRLKESKAKSKVVILLTDGNNNCGDISPLTAAEIAKRVNDKPAEVFFLYAGDYPDALSVSAVAARKNAPVLYLPTNGRIDAATQQYLDSVKGSVKNAYVIGGDGVISDAVMQNAADATGLETNETLTRVAGRNRYLTNLAVNYTFADVLTSNSICTATGKDFPDALAGGVLAAQKGAPILLVSDDLIEEQSDYLAKRAAIKVYVHGGTEAVSDELAHKIAKAA